MYVMESEFKYVRKLNIHIYIYIYSLISNFAANTNLFVFSTPIHISICRLNYHFNTALHVGARFPHHSSYKSWFFYKAISYAIWVYRRRHRGINTHTWNIVNLYQNRSAKPILSYILLFIQPYQIMQTIGNSAECCDHFVSICFISNMCMKESWWHYQYQTPKHRHWITESISENYIIIYLFV